MNIRFGLVCDSSYPVLQNMTDKMKGKDDWEEKEPIDDKLCS